MPASDRAHHLTGEESGLLARMLDDGIDCLRALSLLRRRRQNRGAALDGLEAPAFTNTPEGSGTAREAPSAGSGHRGNAGGVEPSSPLSSDRARVAGADGLTPLRRRVLATIVAAPEGVARGDIAERLGVSRLSILSAARALRDRGLVFVDGARSNARWFAAGVTPPAERPAVRPRRVYALRPLSAAEQQVRDAVQAAGAAGTKRRRIARATGLDSGTVRDALNLLRRRQLIAHVPGVHGLWIAAGVTPAGAPAPGKVRPAATRALLPGERSARPRQTRYGKDWFVPAAQPTAAFRAPARGAASAAVEAFLARGGAITVCPPAAAAPVNNGEGFAAPTGVTTAYVDAIFTADLNQRRQESLRRRGFKPGRSGRVEAVPADDEVPA